MTVTLYQPGALPQELPAIGFTLDAASGEVMQNQALAADLLGCAPSLVDVLASGKGYLVYSVFDHDGAINSGAILALSKLIGLVIDEDNEDEMLRGPVLAVCG